MVKENLASCLKKIEASAQLAGISSSNITLAAVTKSVPLALIHEAIDAGVTNIAENRVQEALLKYGPVNNYAKSKGVSLKWHMVGHIQTNKAKEVVRMFDLIHSVDSIKVALEIDRQAGKINKVQEVLLEVKTSSEEAKYGFAPGEVLEAAKEISALKNIKIRGLMTVAALVDFSEKARPYFHKLKELRDEIINKALSSGLGYNLDILSMGMTDDFEIAIQEGANMVRIGRGIFSERSKI